MRGTLNHRMLIGQADVCFLVESHIEVKERDHWCTQRRPLRKQHEMVRMRIAMPLAVVAHRVLVRAPGVALRVQSAQEPTAFVPEGGKQVRQSTRSTVRRGRQEAAKLVAGIAPASLPIW